MWNPREDKVEEKAILVGVALGRDLVPRLEEELDELGELARTAGARVLDRTLQVRDRINPSTYIGKGKVEEIGARAKELGANLLIFDDTLSPAQARNIEEMAEIRTLDRTELILDIFAFHARSLEAKSQVELAQLEYLLPRLRRMWTHLDRTGGGIGTRGPGETQLEVDRRRIREKISRLKRDLTKIEQDRRVQRGKRESAFRVSLLGYTNVGKTSLLNALTGAGAVVRDQLFTTLDSLTRALALPSGRRVTLTDTVGLIQKLPHELVASFRSTLEEAVQADMLLLVANAGDENLADRLAAAHETLDEVGALDRPFVLVLNQIDRLTDVERSGLEQRYSEAVLVSAVTGDGLPALLDRIESEASRGEVRATAYIPLSEADLLEALRKAGSLLAARYEDGHVVATLKLSPRWHERLERAGFLAPFHGAA